MFRPVTYVWVNATDGHSSNLKVFSVQVYSLNKELQKKSTFEALKEYQ